MLIICTGASGLVGWNFVNQALERGHKVVALYDRLALPERKNLTSVRCDLRDTNAVQRMVLDMFPDAIVNCAAISSPSVVDKNVDLAKKLNIDLPERLAQMAFHVSARFLHLSTDMVFDGTKAPYIFTDMPMPFNLYGQMKLIAEKKVLAAAAKNSVVLRITHVCGNGLAGNRSLNEKHFMAWASGRKIDAPANDIRRPSSAKNVADVLVELCERTSITGIHHFCGSESLSRYDIARRICEHFSLDVNEFVNKTELERPVDLSLDCFDLYGKIKTRPLQFDEILSEMKVPASCENWYFEKTGKRAVKRYKID